LAPPQAYGRAFGLERAGDNAGAIIGPLLAAALVATIGVRHAIFVSVIPGVLAAFAITVAAREARRTLRPPTARRRLAFNIRELRQAGLARVLIAPAFFEFGNVATTLLILRATQELTNGGRGTTAAASLAILLYAGHNAAATAAAVVGGHVVDRVSARGAFAAGAVVYVGGYALFAVPTHSAALLLLGFVLAGVGIGFAETAESAVVAQRLPERLRANGFGMLGLLQALGDPVTNILVQ